MSGTKPNQMRRRRTNAVKNSSDYVSTSDEDTTSTSSMPKPGTIESKKPAQEKTKWQKFQTRFFATVGMFCVCALILYVGHIAVAAMLIAIQVVVFEEISWLGAKPRWERKLSGYTILHPFLLFTSMFFLYGHTLLELALMSNSDASSFSSIVSMLLRHHRLISFSMGCAGLISFVVTLRKGFYKYQFYQLGWCLATIVIVVGQSSLAFSNLLDGLVWLVVPSMCIITNDIMAYMCGMLFGRTPLIKLSPKKTWEGAIGGAIFTIMLAFLLSPLAIKSQLLVCPKRDWSWEHPTCQVHSVFVPQPYTLPRAVQTLCSNVGVPEEWYNDLNVAPFQFHALMFAAFASVVGPFGGFFASGFKRAFGIKDFANTIPGHGGITDRMDCQVLMCAFVFVYKKSFVQPITASAGLLLQYALQLPLEDRISLLNGLRRSVAAESST